MIFDNVKPWMVKLRHAITFIKYFASVVPLFFLPKTFLNIDFYIRFTNALFKDFNSL